MSYFCIKMNVKHSDQFTQYISFVIMHVFNPRICNNSVKIGLETYVLF